MFHRNQLLDINTILSKDLNFNSPYSKRLTPY